MGFNQHLRDLVLSIDQHLGDAATWSGVDGEIRVHFEEDDQQAGWRDARVAVRSRRLMVHQRWVPEPKPGDRFTLLETDEAFEILEEAPVLDRDGYWLCGARPL